MVVGLSTSPIVGPNAVDQPYQAFRWTSATGMAGLGYLPGPTDTALFTDYKEGAGNTEKLEEAFRRSIPLGRIGQPKDLPGAILFFASEDAAYVTGQVLSVSGGLTMNG